MPEGTMARWWTYQRERFPLVTHAPFALVVAAATLGWSTLAGGRPAPSPLTLASAAASAFLFLLQLRVADEWKDAEDDRRHRPERPVPRGLVTLRGLAAVGAVAMAAQATLAALAAPALLATLAALWAYWALMAFEFFVPRWLKARPLAYLLSHMVVTPILALHLSAFDWLAGGHPPPPGLPVLLVAAFGAGLVFEIGRKVWAPEQERPGVGSYTAVWGRPRAVAAWLAAILIAAGAAAAASRTWTAAATAIAVAVAAALAAAAFLRHPRKAAAKAIEGVSAGACFALYLVLGVLPRLWRLP